MNFYSHGKLVCLIAGISFCLPACKKEQLVNKDQLVNSSSVQEKISGPADAFSIKRIIGNYSVRGSRTVYRGVKDGDNIKLSLDYINEKRIVPLSKQDSSLTCGYGETGYVNKGWKYIITYDKATGQIKLAPNDVMAAAITPGSFQTLYTYYDPVFRTFNFQTIFNDLNGDDNEVFEILTGE